MMALVLHLDRFDDVSDPVGDGSTDSVLDVFHSIVTSVLDSESSMKITIFFLFRWK